MLSVARLLNIILFFLGMGSFFPLIFFFFVLRLFGISWNWFIQELQTQIDIHESLLLELTHKEAELVKQRQLYELKLVQAKKCGISQ